MEATTTTTRATPPATARAWEPWFQLACGIVCMAMIANLQYGATSKRRDPGDTLSASCYDDENDNQRGAM